MVTLLSLPDEIILQIIYSLRYCKSTQIYELRALFATCEQINGVMTLHRRAIVEYYTTVEIHGPNIYHRLAGIPHRDNDEPAIIEVSVWMGDLTWEYEHGIPMEIHSETKSSWYRYGKRHRDNGPAYICTSTWSEYYQWWTHGKFIRELTSPPDQH